MANLHPDKVADVVETVLNSFIKHKWVDLSQDRPEYTFASSFMSKGRKIEVLGPLLEHKVQVKSANAARNTSPLSIDKTSIVDLVKSVKIEWSMQTTNMKFGVYDKAFSQGRAAIVDMLKIREHDAITSYYDLQETNLWRPQADISSSDEPRVPYSIPWWIQKGTTDAFGFNGLNPTNYSGGRGGLSSVTYPNSANATANYDEVTDDDLLDKLAECHVKCNFMPAHNFPEIGSGAPDWELFTTYRMIKQLHKLQKNQNDNVGVDLGKYRNMLLFMGAPFKYVPELEMTNKVGYDGSDPIYGINHKVIGCFYQKGRNMVRSATKQSPNQKDGREVHWDNFYNIRCTDLRKTYVVNSN